MLTEKLLKIRDISSQGDTLHEFYLSLSLPSTTVRNLIEQRVRTEFEAIQKEEKLKGIAMFDVSETEKMLNNHAKATVDSGQTRADGKSKFELELDTHIKNALLGFESNRFFITVNDKQVVNLDEPIIDVENCDITFMQLIPLVGG